MKAHRTTVLVAAIAVCGALLCVTPSHAAPPWSSVTPVSAPGASPDPPGLAVDDAGNAVAVWAGALGGIQAATRPVGGTWSAPHPLSDGAPVSPPQVAVDASGCSYAVWIEESAVQLSTRCPSGDWTAPISISGDAEPNPNGDFDVTAVGTGGRAGAVWVTPARVVYGVVGAASAGGWETPAPLSEDTQLAGSPSIGFDAALNATAVWSQGESDDDDTIESSVHPPGGEWGAAMRISGDAPFPVRDPTLAVSASGSATAAWELDTSSGNVIQAASRSSAGDWAAPEDLSDALLDAFTPRAATNAVGDAAVVWNQEEGVEVHAQAVLRPAGDPWGEVADLSNQAVGQSFDGQVVVAADGSATAAWRMNGNSAFMVQAAHLAPGGSWTAPVDIGGASVDSLSPSLAVDGRGNVTAAFLSLVVPDLQVSAATLDTTGPSVDAFNVPATGVVGQGLSYSSAATDTWSPVASYSWKFGDGASASGPAPTHAYVAPGSYAVSLTVTDSVGNKTTRTAATTVAAASAPPPPPVAEQAPAITHFEVQDPKIRAVSRVATDAPAKTKLKIRLTSAADVRIVLRSKHRHLVDGQLKRVKVTLTRRLPGGRSSVTLKGRLATIKLLPDTYRVLGTATNSAGTSPERRARLVVVRPSSVSRIGDPR